jgi:hypothetical protein
MSWPTKSNDDVVQPDSVRPALPEEIEQVLDAVPEKEREVIERFMIRQVSLISRISPEIEVSKKVTAEHITTMLATQDKAMERTFKDKNQRRWFSLSVIGIVSAVLIALVVLLRQNPDAMEKIITIVLSGLLGGAGGYGLGARSKDDE